MFRETPTYRENSDAHGIRSINVIPPAMTWHTAFWIPQKFEDNSDNITSFEKSRNRESVEETLDAMLIAITKGLKADKHKSVTLRPSVGGVVVMFSKYVNEDDLSEIRFIEGSLPEEYVEIETIISSIKENDRRSLMVEFEWLNYWITMNCTIQTEYFTINTIAEKLNGDHALFEEIGPVNFFAKAFEFEPEASQDGAIKDCNLDILFDQFWDKFNKFVRSLEHVSESIPKSMFEQIYMDSRGLIISDASINRSIAGLQKEKSDDFDPTQWAHSLVEHFKDDLTTKGRYECTASLMLDERAVFMTALGPQNPDRKPNSRNPLTFLICVRSNLPSNKMPINKWQLGRLIDRIHFLGRVRLAALRNVKVLRAVSAELSRIDGMIANARNDVEKYGSQDGIGTIDVTNIGKLRKRLNFISDHFLDLTKSESKSGILYRVERSRYYVEQFRKNIPQLRITRIEGYQKYDDFVEKRLGGVFDSIHRIGVRYERALRAMAAIDQNYLAAQSHNLADQSQKTSSSIEEIQKWGELFLISILVPYYSLGILKSLVEARVLYGNKMLVPGIVILTVFGLLGTVRFARSNKLSTESIRTLGFGLIALIAIIIVSYVQVKIKDGGH